MQSHSRIVFSRKIKFCNQIRRQKVLRRLSKEEIAKCVCACDALAINKTPTPRKNPGMQRARLRQEKTLPSSAAVIFRAHSPFFLLCTLSSLPPSSPFLTRPLLCRHCFILQIEEDILALFTNMLRVYALSASASSWRTQIPSVPM